MPNNDGTGPRGFGPMTGRGFGPCGRGLRRGFGRGYCRYVDPVSFTKTEEKKILEEELKQLELEKVEVSKRLKELKD